MSGARSQSWLWALLLRTLRPLILLLSWGVKTAYKVLFFIRLFVLILERDSARAASGRGGAQDEYQQRIDDGTAWVDFCDSLKGLIDFVVTPPHAVQQPGGACSAAGGSAGAGAGTAASQGGGGDGSGAVALDALDRREGLRYLTRIMRGGMEAFLDCWDPAWPVLRPLPYNVKMGADNPDNLYMYGTVSGEYEYRVYGNRGSVAFFSIGLYCGSRPGLGSSQPVHVYSRDLVCTPEGEFEVFLTPTPCGSNWAQLPRDASRVVVRQTFLNRATERAADVRIERLFRGPGGPGTASVGGHAQGAGAGGGSAAAAAGGRHDVSRLEGRPSTSGAVRVVPPEEVKPELSAAQVVSALSGAAVFISGSIHQFQTWSRQFAARPNQLFTLDHDVYMTAWADPAIHFFHGYWRLEEGQALVITATPPECPYWNFQLDNWWMESLDYEAHPHTTANKATAGYLPNGAFCLVVAHTDPRARDLPASASAGPGTPLISPREGGPAMPLPLAPTSPAATTPPPLTPRASSSGVPASSPVRGRAEAPLADLPKELLAGVTWVDTAHHTHGTMGLRWVGASEHPVPQCSVVRVGPQLVDAVWEAARKAR